MIEIKCTKAQYERLIECTKSYYEDGKCFLGKTIRFTCPNFNKPNIDCGKCLREHIKRVNGKKKDNIKSKGEK